MTQEEQMKQLTPKQLKAWRERFGWDFDQAAEVIGVTSRAVRFYENGQRPIPLTVTRIVGLTAAMAREDVERLVAA